MKTTSTFNIDGENITKGFQKLFMNIQDSNLKIATRSNKNLIDIPLIFGLVAAIIFPFITIVAVLMSIISFIKISIERKSSVDISEKNKMIELK